MSPEFAPRSTHHSLIMAEVQNSNPTILNVADLPTRSRANVKSGDYDNGIFAAVPNPADFLSSDSEQEDDLLEEPIDEQEIYGRSSRALLLTHSAWQLSDSRQI